MLLIAVSTTRCSAELQAQAYLVPLKAAGDAHSSMKGAFATGASLAAGKRF